MAQVRRQTAGARRLQRRMVKKRKKLRRGRKYVGTPTAAQRRGFKKLSRTMKRGGLARRISKLRSDLELPVTLGLTEYQQQHTSEYIQFAVEEAAAQKQADTPPKDVQELVKWFLEKPPIYSQTDAGLAALQFESWLAEKATDVYAQLIETQVLPNSSVFHTAFAGQIRKDRVTEVQEGTTEFLECEVVLNAGDRNYQDHSVSDVTIFECKPKPGAKLDNPFEKKGKDAKLDAVVPKSVGEDYRLGDHAQWERALKVGSRVEARWTSANLHYRAPSVVKKVNRLSVVVELGKDVSSGVGGVYPKGHKIVVPRIVSLKSARGRWSQNNGVFPVDKSFAENLDESMTPGVHRRLSAETGARTCPSCGFSLLSYVGRYPAACPSCGATLVRPAEDVGEVSPLGWKASVEKMKKHKEITNPFALAYWMKKRGAKPHYPETEDLDAEDLLAYLLGGEGMTLAELSSVEEKDGWVTTKGGHRIQVKNGKVVKGNPKVLAKIKEFLESIVECVLGEAAPKRPKPPDRDDSDFLRSLHAKRQVRSYQPIKEAIKVPAGEFFNSGLKINGHDVVITRRGKSLQSPMVVYIDGKERDVVKKGEKAAKRRAKELALAEGRVDESDGWRITKRGGANRAAVAWVKGKATITHESASKKGAAWSRRPHYVVRGVGNTDYGALSLEAAKEWAAAQAENMEELNKAGMHAQAGMFPPGKERTRKRKRPSPLAREWRPAV